MKNRIWIALGAVVLIIIGLVALKGGGFLSNSSNDEKVAVDSAKLLSKPTMLYGFPIDSMVIVESRVKRNQSLSTILEDYNIPYTRIIALAHKSKPTFDVRKINPNKDYTLICFPDSLHTAKAMIYEPNPTEYVIFHLGDTLHVEKFKRKIDTVEKIIAGVITHSLAASVNELGGSPQLTNEIVDVLAWQVDFFRLNKGDRFKIIYQEEQVNGIAIGIGEIKGAYFNHYSHPYYAYYFDQGTGIDYFDEEGNSMRKALLKYPLDFTRISSRYSGARFHPVQKRWKAHLGTDFAAPRGTPIRSVGDGLVVKAQYNKYNGNFVKIKHNSTYSTQYLHMSGIAKGVKRGAKVKQGQIIGYVGMTGLATGNHLCYRFWKNGVQVDALKVKIPPSEPIKPENLHAFMDARDALRYRLDAIPYVPINVLAGTLEIPLGFEPVTILKQGE